MNLSENQIDLIRETINIGVGRSAAILNKMINKHIRLQVPYVAFAELEKIKELFSPTPDEELSSVNLNFKGSLIGAAKLIFPTDSASKLVDLFTDSIEDDNDMDEIKAGTLSEIGNIVLNSLIGTISNTLRLPLNYSVPSYQEGIINDLLAHYASITESAHLFAQTRFIIEEMDIIGDFILLLEVESSFNFLRIIDQFLKNQLQGMPNE